MMRMNGNFESMHELKLGLERLAAEGAREIERRAAVAIDLQIEKQFARGESAEGERWANKADGSPSFLQKSTKMRRSKRVTGVGGIKVTLDKPAGFHQGGTKNADGSQRMPARPIAPIGDSLHGNWAKPIVEVVREVFAEVRGG